MGESGGQIGDRGLLVGQDLIVEIEAVSRLRKLFVHHGRIERGVLQLGDQLNARVDRRCRRRAQAHHTATHLLQAALKLADTPEPVQGGNGLGPQLLSGTAGLLQFLAPLAIKAFVPLPF